MLVRGGLGSVVLRTITEGRKPETPTRIEAIFFTSGANPLIFSKHDVVLIRNGTPASLHATEKNGQQRGFARDDRAISATI